MDPTRATRTLPFAASFTLCCALLGAQTFPGPGWPVASPESQGIDGTVLAGELAALPWPANQGPILVVANGYVIHTVGDVTQPEYLYSCSKVVTAMVCAGLVQAGRIGSFDDPVPNNVPGAWGSSYPADSTWRMFMTMTSDYGLSPYHPLAGQYGYNNNAVDFYGETMGQTFFGVAPDRMDVVVDRALFDAIGRNDPVSFTGQWGGWYGGLQLSCRDFARLGLLLLRGGEWDGRRLLSREFADGLFECQIPPSAGRYWSGDPRQNTQFNQQEFTDLLGGNWSFGLWRVHAGGATGGNNFVVAAAEGYRGKRLLLCPPGSLPDPGLEVVLACLPRLSDEGPDSGVYFAAIQAAVKPQPVHPDHDPQCLAVTFDDGVLDPLEAVAGQPEVRGGRLVFEGGERVAYPEATYRDGDAVLRIASGMPADSRIGFVVRAGSASVGARADGEHSWIHLHHLADSRLRVEVLHRVLGNEVLHVGPVLKHSLAQGPLELRVGFAGGRVFCSVGGEDALGPDGYGIPDPPAGGLLQVESEVGAGEIAVDYVLARAPDGPIGQVAVERDGAYSLSMFGPTLFQRPLPYSFRLGYEYEAVDLTTFAAIQPYAFPSMVLGRDHFIVSTRGAILPIELGNSLVFHYAGMREGEFLR